MKKILHEYSDPRPTLVVARTRKRCMRCGKMVERGERAVLTDDRYLSSAIQWHGRKYARGAWHLTHEACSEDRERSLPVVMQ